MAHAATINGEARTYCVKCEYPTTMFREGDGSARCRICGNQKGMDDEALADEIVTMACGVLVGPAEEQFQGVGSGHAKARTEYRAVVWKMTENAMRKKLGLPMVREPKPKTERRRD